MCEPEDIPDRDVALAPFNSADIGTVEASAFGERLLGNTDRSSEVFQVEGNDLLRPYRIYKDSFNRELPPLLRPENTKNEQYV